MKVNREIKFRGFSEDKWIVGNLFNFTGSINQGQNYISDYGSMVDHSLTSDRNEAAIGFFKEVDTKSVGQFTGLRDEDGTEIYEGDIVEVDREKSVIESVPGGFTVASLPLVEVSNYGMKVIGNIHENTELLECGEE